MIKNIKSIVFSIIILLIIIVLCILINDINNSSIFKLNDRIEKTSSGVQIVYYSATGSGIIPNSRFNFWGIKFICPEGIEVLNLDNANICGKKQDIKGGTEYGIIVKSSATQLMTIDVYGELFSEKDGKVIAQDKIQLYAEPSKIIRNTDSTYALRPSPEELIFKPVTTYYLKEKNFSIDIKNSWEVVDNDTVNLPPDIDGLQLAFKKKNTECILAYIITSNIYNNYRQSSFGYRVNIKQIFSDWMIRGKDAPQGFNFSYYARQPLPGEILVQYKEVIHDNGRKGVFILFNQNKGTVADDCAFDAISMISTFKEKFDNVNINTGSNGVLYYTDSIDTNFYFLDDINPIQKAFEVKIDYSTTPIIYKNLIYYTENGILRTLDLFTQKSYTLPNISFDNSESIIDFSIQNNKIFFLTGNENCNEYRAHCNLSLYSYDIETKINKLLSNKDVPARKIVSYDPINNILDLAWTDGDAGCYWISAMSFDLKLGTTTNYMDYSYCYDVFNEKDVTDSDNKNQKSSKNFFEREYANATNTDYILINRGKILPPTGKLDFPSQTRRVFKFVY